MGLNETAPEKRSAAGVALLYAGVLFIAWTGAWLLNTWLESQKILPGQPLDRFLYWLAARVLLWVLPSLALLRGMGKSFREVLALRRVKESLLWGGIVGLIWGGKAPLLRLVMHQPVHPIVWDWSFVTAVVYAPLVEEITYRGAIQTGLLTRMPFAAANLITGLLFLSIHLPGWYFEGAFGTSLINVLSQALGVLLLGWIFGWVAKRSKSLAASTLTHMLNNLFQRFVD